MTYVRWFDETVKDDIALAGGKGVNLGEMVRAGLPVPPGFIITTEAYRAFVEANDLQPRILELARADNPASVEAASRAIRRLFDQGSIPQSIADAILEAYHTPQLTIHNSVAVRSSATAEDLPSASFAGQQETYLNIQGDDAVLEAVENCWSSLWTPRAMAYRTRNNISPDDVALAVVVQAMVPAAAAGILFTANPTTGARDEVVVNAAWGPGRGHRRRTGHAGHHHRRQGNRCSQAARRRREDRHDRAGSRRHRRTARGRPA